MRRERIEEIKKDVEREFPGDFALQQVHIARKLLAEEAREIGEIQIHSER
jgi:anti-sigma28 factor (negative regulator of flagellin synthesis)